MGSTRFACAVVVALALSVTSLTFASELDEGFAKPPASAKPWVYWFIMDGNQSREGITADFEAMRRVGIGGLIMMEVDVGIPKGPVHFMSPEWRELFKHANKEAARLGLVMTMPASPGWTGSGGPWVTPEQSMQKVVWTETKIEGGKHFDGKLPQPQTIANFYRDIAVLAYPTPRHPQRISNADEKSLARRGHFSSEGGVKALLIPPTTSPAPVAGEVVASDRIINVTDKLDSAGTLTWDAPPDDWTVVRFGHTSTGANTRPAPAAGLGLECDKLDRAALDKHFNDFLDKLLRDIGPLAGKSLVNLHIDSWEMGPQNWSPKFPAEFKARRGYDLMRYLPAMTGQVVDSADVTERFLWDIRQTVLELIADNHAGHLAELAHQRGLGLSIEPYDGTPCDDMTYGSRADVPMCEFWHDTFRTWFSVDEATSIAHTTGKRVVAAEAFTSGSGERWLADPASLKPLGDWALCTGVNRFVFHRYAHQPWLDRKPGMTMGPYGIHMERTQTWWEMSRAWMKYLSRCQFMLQQGTPVADVLFLTPEASPQVFRPPSSATRGDPPARLGYNFDAVTPDTLLKSAKVNDAGQIVLAEGTAYRVLVLPQTRVMTPALLRKVGQLVRDGTTVIGPPPVQSPSLSDYPKCDEDVRRLAGEIWGECDGLARKAHPIGKGKVVWDRAADVDLSAETASPLAGAAWIWNSPNAAKSGAPGTAAFRREFTLPAKAIAATLAVTCDNSFVAYVNGQRVGAGNNFHSAERLDIARSLKTGENVITIEARNEGDAPNPAGLIAAVEVTLEGGQKMRLVSDGQWQTAEAIDAKQWNAAAALGPIGMPPWGELATSNPDVFCDYALVTNVLKAANIPPDFESAESAIRYGHRRDGVADIYFVANSDDSKTVEADCFFRAEGEPELWDPLTGTCRPLPQSFAAKDGRTRIPLRLEPAQSFFVLFRNPAPAVAPEGVNFAQVRPLAELTGSWNVSFDPKWGGPDSVTFDALVDWTKRPEDGIRHYSGTATYRKTFDVSPLPKGERIVLDLGKVKNLAQVRLNGKDLGIVWCPPWRVDITNAVKTHENKLEIDVVNLWPNRLIGDQSLAPEKRFTNTTWNPFGKDDALLESGLLGPVRLISE